MIRDEIWSLGITAYELALGRPPLAEQEPMKINLLLARADPPRLEGDFSRSFKDFVNLCLNKEVKKRPTIKELLTHPFIRKSKKISNLLDMVGKLNRQQNRISQRNIDTSVVNATIPTRSPKRTRAFSTNAITGRLRSDTSSDDSGSELGGSLTFSNPGPGGFSGISHSPSFDSGISSSSPTSSSSGGTTKIGMTISRLRNNGTGTPPPLMTSSFSSSSATTSQRGASAFTSTSSSAFTPTSNPLPSASESKTTTTTTVIGEANKINKDDKTSTKVSFEDTTTTTTTTTITDRKPSLSNSADPPTLTVTSPKSAISPLIMSASTPSLPSSISSPPDSSLSTAPAKPSVTSTSFESQSALSSLVAAILSTSSSSSSTSSSSSSSSSVSSSFAPSSSSSSLPPSTLSTSSLIPNPIQSSPSLTITTTTTTSSSGGGLAPTVILPSSNSTENINESDFQSFVTPLSPPVTPKLKTPLLTMPPSSSFLDSVILPVLAKKGRAQTEETQIVMQDLKEAFKKLENLQSGASQQLVNDWVEAVLWENYSQEKGSPMANYLLLRWKNGTPL